HRHPLPGGAAGDRQRQRHQDLPPAGHLGCPGIGRRHRRTVQGRPAAGLNRPAVDAEKGVARGHTLLLWGMILLRGLPLSRRQLADSNHGGHELMKNRTRFFAAIAVLALVVAACGDGSGEGTTTTAGGGAELELKTPGTLTVCTDVPYPPMEFTVAEPGWEAITGGLAFETECDVAAASITITEERAENVDFSDPYFEAVQSLLVREDSGINGLEDMAGKKLAVQTGTTGHFY